MSGDAYHHTQKSPWGLMCYAFVAAFVVATLSLPVLALEITFLGTGLVMFLLGVSFHYLTVEDESDRLGVRFGPFPLFRRRIPYEDIVEVETGRTTFWLFRFWVQAAIVGVPPLGGFRFPAKAGTPTDLPFAPRSGRADLFGRVGHSLEPLGWLGLERVGIRLRCASTEAGQAQDRHG